MSHSIFDFNRAWFNHAFDNPDVRPVHHAIYYFAIELNNKLGWKDQFDFPSSQAMEATGIKSYNTYIKAFREIVEWNFFILYRKSQNQYQANIIGLSKIDKSLNTSFDKSVLNHLQDQIVITEQITDSKDIHDTNRPKNQYKPKNPDYCEKDFLKDWNELRTKHLKKPSHLNNIGGAIERSSFNDLLESYSREDFKNALIGLFKQKAWPNDNSQMASNPKHFLSHFNTYLTAFHDRNTELYGKQKTEATL